MGGPQRRLRRTNLQMFYMRDAAVRGAAISGICGAGVVGDRSLFSQILFC